MNGSRAGKLSSLLVVALVLLIPNAVLADWDRDGSSICSANGLQYLESMISQDDGGAIFAWADFRYSATPDIFVQRIDQAGNILWTADGVAICTAAYGQYNPAIVTDGAGGAIVAWHDNRNGDYEYDIYAQRIDASGSVLWTMDGVPLCTATAFQERPALVSDGSGGAIVTWQDARSDPNKDIYAQRIDSSGAVQWTTDGVPLCTVAGYQKYPLIVEDGSGGAIVTWQDYRGADSDIYAQRVNSSGSTLWTTDGVVVCSATGYQEDAGAVSDGYGGAVVAWRDNRSGPKRDIYAQKVDASGVAQWTADGVVLSAATDNQETPVVTTDGAGGAIVAWRDYRSGTDWDIYAQRVDASGVVQWTADGVALCTAAGWQLEPAIVSDGVGGAIVAWADRRAGPGFTDIYAQRVNDSGALQWATNGIAACAAPEDQNSPKIASDSGGGAITAWIDGRSPATSSDIYAQRIRHDGIVVGNLVPITTGAAVVIAVCLGTIAIIRMRRKTLSSGVRLQ